MRHWKRVGIFISDYLLFAFELRAENLLILFAILVLTFNDATVITFGVCTAADRPTLPGALSITKTLTPSHK